MYGFLLRPKWIAFHLLVLGAVALMISLGFWQLRRLEERKDFNELVTERVEQAPVPLDDVLVDAGADPAGFEWRQVTVSGQWVPEQVIWFNRTQDGVAGDNVLTALAGADGTTVVVNRGFVAIGTAVPAPPTGEVDVLGRIRTSQTRRRGELTDTTTGPVDEVRRVDLGQLAGQLPGEVAPFYLDLIDSVPPVADTDPVPAPAPTLDDGPHLSYAAQWFIFAVCVVIGWVLAVRRSVTTRRHAAQVARTVTAESGGQAPSGSPTPADDASARSST